MCGSNGKPQFHSKLMEFGLFRTQGTKSQQDTYKRAELVLQLEDDFFKLTAA